MGRNHQLQKGKRCGLILIVSTCTICEVSGNIDRETPIMNRDILRYVRSCGHKAKFTEQMSKLCLKQPPDCKVHQTIL